jgi:hypothetical protein
MPANRKARLKWRTACGISARRQTREAHRVVDEAGADPRPAGGGGARGVAGALARRGGACARGPLRRCAGHVAGQPACPLFFGGFLGLIPACSSGNSPAETCCHSLWKYAEYGERERFEGALSAVAEESPGRTRSAETASPRHRAIASSAAARPWARACGMAAVPFRYSCGLGETPRPESPSQVPGAVSGKTVKRGIGRRAGLTQ